MQLDFDFRTDVWRESRHYIFDAHCPIGVPGIFGPILFARFEKVVCFRSQK